LTRIFLCAPFDFQEVWCELMFFELRHAGGQFLHGRLSIEDALHEVLCFTDAEATCDSSSLGGYGHGLEEDSGGLSRQGGRGLLLDLASCIVNETWTCGKWI